MSLKTLAMSRITRHITGESRQTAHRRKAEEKRRREGRPHMIEYFHVADDPYSHLLVQLLPELLARYDVTLKPWLTPPPPDWAAPERQKLDDYARRDAERLAARAGLDFTDPGAQPSPDRVRAAEAVLASLLDAPDFAARSQMPGNALWNAAALPEMPAIAPDLLAHAAKRRETLGHYLGAMLHYEGEWYWGIDRLHYLERRLRDLGAHKPGAPDAFLFPPPELDFKAFSPGEGTRPELHFYLSFRSPYTYIAAERVKALADAAGADLKLRFVLPMVMRGLPVPRMKGLYISKDCAREARRLGIPFGKIADPVGKPVERGYALLPHAIEQGLGYAYCHSFLQGVWAEGIDAGSDHGLRQIAERAGLNWAAARELIGGDHWRAEAEANRAEMMSLGIWGVPSFRVGNIAVWGQDRLWVIADALSAGQGKA